MTEHVHSTRDRRWNGLRPRLERLSARAERWRRPLTPLRIALAVFVVVNLLLLSGYLWSRGGQTTHVRLTARGDLFEAFVDGDLLISQRLDAPVRGGLAVNVENTRKIPSLPKPRGIDHVRVRDLASDVVLFEDDFSDWPNDDWVVTQGVAVQDGDVLDVQRDGAIAVAGRQWTDVVVDIDFRNVVGAAVLIRAPDPQSGVVFSMRPFRQYDSGLAVMDRGEVVTHFVAGRVEPDRGEMLRSMLAMTLRPYPLIAVLAALGFAAVLVLQFGDLLWGRLRAPRVRGELLAFVAVGVIAAGACGVAAFLLRQYGGSMPHVQDSVAYVFQAKLFASGRLFAPAPPVAEVFDFSTPPFVAVADGKWAGVYPFGHPFALAFGERLGAIWLVPPLLGAAAVVLVFLIGRRVYGTLVGLLAALLLASSPFFFMTAGNFMSHTTAVFYLLASLCCLVIGGRWPLASGLAAGLFFGLMFNTQSLAAVALVPAFGALLLYRLVPSDRRRAEALRLAGFVAGGLAMLGLYYLYNYATRGDPFTSGFSAAGFKVESEIGFGGEHSVNIGIQNQQTQLTFLLLVLNGWPQQVGLLFVLGLFALATRNLWDWFFLACAVSLIGVYTLFIGHGIMHGPRYWYPALPFLLLLTARGADRAAELFAEGAAWLRRRLTGAGRPARWAGVLVAYGLVAVLIGGAISSWLLSRHIAWDADFVPARAIELQGFNGADDRLVRLIKDAELDDALVLVQPCAVWQCYGTVFWLNEPSLDGDVVIARDLPERRAELFAAYPERRVYLATYQPPSLVPFGSTPAAPEDEAPRARDIVELLPSPTPTPDQTEAERVRDEQRRQDLEVIAGVLQEYHRQHGSYPPASAVQSVCRYRELDAACALLELLDPLPQDPTPGATYYYFSDGATFMLFALTEQETDSSRCPSPRPPEIAAAEHLYCLPGAPP